LQFDQMLSLETYVVARKDVFMMLEGSLDGRADIEAGDFLALLAAEVEFLHGADGDVTKG
jgi:hypothetical protein